MLDVKRSLDITWLIGAPQWIGSGLLAPFWMHYWLADRKPCSDNKGRNDSANTGKPPLISHLLVHLFPCWWSCLHMSAKSVIVQHLFPFFLLSFFPFTLTCCIFHQQYQNQNKTAVRVMECQKSIKYCWLWQKMDMWRQSAALWMAEWFPKLTEESPRD